MITGRQLSRLFVDTIAKNYVKCISSLRFNSQKTDNGKVEAAILKKVGDPLVLEHVDPPKITKPNEVSVLIQNCLFYLFFFSFFWIKTIDLFFTKFYLFLNLTLHILSFF